MIINYDKVLGRKTKLMKQVSGLGRMVGLLGVFQVGDIRAQI